MLPPTYASPWPPLLHTYTAPSGPMAAPLGPPPRSATTSTAPPAETRLSVPRLISTRSTSPLASAIGPSGNCRPPVSSRGSAVVVSVTSSPFGNATARTEQRRHDLAVDARERERSEDDLDGE